MAEIESGKRVQICNAPSLLHRKALIELARQAVRTKKGSGYLVSLQDCQTVIGRKFHIHKNEILEFLNEMQDLGLCRVSQCNGVYLD